MVQPVVHTFAADGVNGLIANKRETTNSVADLVRAGPPMSVSCRSGVNEVTTTGGRARAHRSSPTALPMKAGVHDEPGNDRKRVHRGPGGRRPSPQGRGHRYGRRALH